MARSVVAPSPQQPEGGWAAPPGAAEVYHHYRPGRFPPEIWERASERFYPEGGIIIQPGQSPRHFYKVRMGRVRLAMPRHDGAEKVISYVGCGEFFGEVPFFQAQPYWYMAQAMEPVQVLALTHADLADIRATNPEIMLALLESMAHKTWMMSTQLMAVAYEPSEARIAGILLEMLYRLRQPPLRITHQEVAALASTSRVTVTKTLNMWREQGLIHTRKGSVTNLDVGRLQRIAAGRCSRHRVG